MSSSQGARFGEAVEGLTDSIDALFEVAPDDLTGDDLLDHMGTFETLRRRIEAMSVRLADRVDRSGAYRLDGHMSAKVCLRHRHRISGPEAAGRMRMARALRDLPEVAAAHDSGELSTGHVQLFANVWSNPRVRHLLPLSEAPLLANALISSHLRFGELIRQWEQLADVDGAFNEHEVSKRRRRFRMTQNEDGSWTLSGSLPSGDGAIVEDIFSHFAKQELEVDWDKARVEHGDEVCVDDLPRTAQQRAADALVEMAQRAATAAPGRRPGDPITSVVMDKRTFDEEVARLFGETVESDLTDIESRRCSTATGHRLHPREALLHAIHGKIRRVVIGADGAVIDLGRASRFFTGSARDAALLANPTCTHPGCEIPSAWCDADHVTEWSQNGPTNATVNGNPRCRFHNNIKNHGYRTWRDSLGDWHSVRPDGTPIE